MSGFTPFTTPLGLVGSTGAAGYTLVNGTGLIPGLSYQAPSDGQPHYVIMAGEIVVSVAETGGGIQANFTPPTGGPTTLQMAGGGLAVGARAFSNTVLMVAPGSLTTIAQSAALTAGAAVLFAGLWAA